MKYYIIAGETSGDLHGSNLMKGLKIADQNAEFRFWGGDLMQEVGGTLVKHYRETAVMGFIEVLGSLGKIAANLSLCKKDIIEYQPDVIILIDYPGFNFKIARFAKKNKFRVFYYISPKVWAWKESRIKNLKKDIDKLFIIFPFEIDYFKKHGIEAIYNGNPLLDSIMQHKCQQESERQFRERIGVEDKPIIGLLPGSRLMEINYLLPKMVQLEKEFPNHLFLLGAAPSISKEAYNKHLKGTNIKYLPGESYPIMKHASVTVLASGTASLEAALLNSPQVVCYGGNELSFQIAKRLVKVKYVSLVNLILNKPLVKELLQHHCTPNNITKEVKKLFKNKKREEVFIQYKKIRELLGGEGASVKVAAAMIEELEKIKDKERYFTTLNSPIGKLKLTSGNSALLSVEYIEEENIEEENIEETTNCPPVLIQAKKELKEYFNKERTTFSVPIKPEGTEFQLKVWKQLSVVPYGNLKSYGHIAKQIGDKDASRAVGMACKMNPIPIIIPCHRIVSSNNKLTGYNMGLDKKSFLLAHEDAFDTNDTNLFTEEPDN
ncbi:MAG: lipid-A-disaccharide synthase [Bacteroidales bacterium]